MELTNEDVADILALLDSLPYDELDLQTSKFRLTLRRAANGAWTETRQVTAGPQVIDAAVPEAASTPATGQAGIPDDSSHAGLIDISTSLPGTFYRAPRPGAAPFVEVGAQVHEDTVVAIVETMKLMNPVHAATRGRVAEICVANGEPVPQGAVLLRIEPELP